jgi:hypothetical protein
VGHGRTSICVASPNLRNWLTPFRWEARVPARLTCLITVWYDSVSPWRMARRLHAWSSSKEISWPASKPARHVSHRAKGAGGSKVYPLQGRHMMSWYLTQQTYVLGAVATQSWQHAAGLSLMWVTSAMTFTTDSAMSQRPACRGEVNDDHPPSSWPAVYARCGRGAAVYAARR